MSIASDHLSTSRFVELTQTHDPFTVLGDLEITLILGFLSIKETIAIRRVSTLWKACVDFRLSKAAIGRHFPEATEASAKYSNWEEESSAFRKLAYFQGSKAKPNIARTFDIGTVELWCICNHHMVWVDETHINIQRLWDPEKPTCDSFRVIRKNLKLIQLKDKPRRFENQKARWIVGDDKNGIVLLYLGASFNKPTHAKWLLAISVTGHILWHKKYTYTIRRPILPGQFPKANYSSVSFGHGKLCFIDSGDHPPDHSQCVTYCVAHNLECSDLVVIDVFSGTQKVRKLIPGNDPMPQGPILNFSAHPTQEVYFLLRDREMSVFSTRTGDLIESYSIPLGSPSVDLGHQRNFSYIHFGSGGQTWLLFETKSSIVGYEIELEKFQIARQRTWSLTPNDNCVGRLSQATDQFIWGTEWSTRLDPVSGVLYVIDQEDGRPRETPSRITAVEFEPTEGTLGYHIKSFEFLTLPPKKKNPTRGAGAIGTKSHGELTGTSNEIELPGSRRRFEVPLEVTWHLFWRTGPYIMLQSNGSKVWVFGCVPQW